MWLPIGHTSTPPCLVLVEADLPKFTLLLLAHSKDDHTMPLQHALVFEVAEQLLHDPVGQLNQVIAA